MDLTIPNHVICEVAFNPDESLLLLLKNDVFINLILEDQEKRYRLGKLNDDEYYPVESNAINSLTTSRKGLVCLVCEEKKIYVLT
jgi:hypothetical protein